jgi:hypothetical protein
MIWIKLGSLGPPLFQNLGNDSPRKVLIILDLLVVRHVVLGWQMLDSKLSLISDLAHLPLSESIEVIIECLLLESLELLELKDLSEEVLVREDSAFLGVLT